MFFLLFAFSVSNAQDKYWVFFNERDMSKEEPVSRKTYSNRRSLRLQIIQETDFGPYASQIKELSDAGFKVQNTSRWFNAASFYLTDSEKDRIKALPFVKEIRKITNYQSVALNKIPAAEEGIYLSYPLHQIKAGVLIEKGWLGEGVDVGVIDGGFFDANSDQNLNYLFENKQVKAVKDFFSPPKINFYGEKKSEGEIHGTMVTTAIAGYNQAKKQLFGLALKSNFYLARTESSQREARIEEDNWIAAIEWLDSLGVRLANSSLGYATGFTNPAESYKPEQMDGKTSLIAQGARMAVNDKGMVLVISAGNEGDNKGWGGLVSTPGDVEEVISVGANDEHGMRMSYSSKGVETVPFIKPDVTVYSQFGTSLAAPVITGLIAGLLSKKPDLTSKDIKKLLGQSASLSEIPNNFVGFGIPDVTKMVDILEGTASFKNNIEFKKGRSKVEIKTTQDEGIVVFHKKDQRNVISQVLTKAEKGKVLIFKPETAKKSTVVLNDKIVEISWRD